MTIKKFDVWLANLNPQRDTETGKVRPVLIIQTDLLNRADHPSTIICPFTTNLLNDNILRILLKKEDGIIDQDSNLMFDQLRAIDNKKFIKKLGLLPARYHHLVNERISLVLDL
jgi:mRNA interferase MazF